MKFSTEKIGIEIKFAWQDFIEEQQPDLFVTLVFNEDVNQDAARSRLDRFDAMVDKALIGRRFANKPARDRTLFFAFFEKGNSHPHFHLLVKPAGGKVDEYVLEAKRVWGEICPAGSIRVEKPRSRKATIRYSSKCIGNLSAYQGIVLSTELRRG